MPRHSNAKADLVPSQSVSRSSAMIHAFSPSFRCRIVHAGMLGASRVTTAVGGSLARSGRSGIFRSEKTPKTGAEPALFMIYCAVRLLLFSHDCVQDIKALLNIRWFETAFAFLNELDE